MAKIDHMAPIKDSSSDGPRIRQELVDELLKDYKNPADLIGPNGLLKELMGALINRAMDAELTHHLGYEGGEPAAKGTTNRRNGKGRKRVRTDHGQVEIQVPRDREGTFEPRLVPKHQRHFNGFDDKIISMYARGMTVREIQAHLHEIYGVDVSPDLISRATDAVVDELRTWQSRPLEAVYPIVYLDALVVKTRQKGAVQNRSVYLAVGVSMDGQKDVLGMWIQATEGAKFWLAILDELKQRGVQDVFVLCADGLKGMSKAVEAAFPQAIFQTCIVHVIRSSTRFVPWKERKAVCVDLRAIYTAATVEDALVALDRFESLWGQRYPMVVTAWRSRWDEISPFLAYPAEIRRAIYTTNTLEGLNRQIRKVTKTRGHMPNDDAALKLLYLVIRNVRKKWIRPHHTWAQARLQFAIHFGDRIPV
jgi:putative transposase